MGTQGCLFDRLQSETPSTSAVVLDQTIVNQQILAQLSVIGTRLDKLEREKSVKRSKQAKTAGKSAWSKNKTTTSAKSAHTHVQSTGTLVTPSTASTEIETLNLPTLDKCIYPTISKR